MYLSQNFVLYVSLIIFSCRFCVKAKPIDISLQHLKVANYNAQHTAVIYSNDDTTKLAAMPKTRAKRSNPSNERYLHAALMPQMKTVQMFLQNFKNMAAAAISGDPTIGGSHPLAVYAVKPVVKLFKERIYDILFPEIGAGHAYD